MGTFPMQRIVRNPPPYKAPENLGHFPPFFVRYCDNGHFQYVRMLVDYVFHLDRRRGTPIRSGAPSHRIQFPNLTSRSLLFPDSSAPTLTDNRLLYRESYSRGDGNFPPARTQTFRSLLHCYTHSLRTGSPRPIYSKLRRVGPGTVVGVSRVRIRARCAVSEVPQPARDDTAGFIGKIHLQGSIPRPGGSGKMCLGGSVDSDVARLSTGACSLGSCHGKRHRVGAGLSIGVVRVPDFARLAVSKVPEPFCEASGGTVCKVYFQGCFATGNTRIKNGCEERCICPECGSGYPVRDVYRLAGGCGPTLQAAKGDRVRSYA